MPKKLTGWLIALALLSGLLIITFGLLIPNWGAITAVFASSETFRAWIESLGIWGPLIYLLVQTAQVIVAPIPGNLVGLVGGASFGPVWGFVLSATGIIVGSSLAFWLARWLGARWVIKFVGEKNYHKYRQIFEGKISWTLLIIFLIPFFPDDILCILAGLSPLPYLRFLALVIIGRLPSVFITNSVGAGLFKLPDVVIPGWVWLIGGVIVVGLIILYFLNKDKITAWFEKKLLTR
jgi:uncharacterized membrane protein YdjX (TVP38/TMEM64 family)